ncbi:MAG: ABC transporter ATP-binding protein [Acidobacteriota bacterium]|nr:ABC transporter ATP-binding protein [Acidobacteriota bacterium]
MRTSSDERSAAHLHVDRLTAGYGGAPVIEDIEIEVGRGEIVTIVGPNGAGKSTLVKALIGVIKPSAGRVLLAGQDLTGMRTDQICRRAIGYIPQVRDIFPRLTVRENLEMGGYALPRGACRARVESVLDIYPRLREMVARQGGHLSGGERKMLAMARALMTEPTLMVLDEPTAGLAPKIADELLSEQVTALARRGVSVLMVEQRAREAMTISDRAYVMASGRVVISDRAAVILARPDIGDVFLGRTDGLAVG